jgi:hypothetical protein
VSRSDHGPITTALVGSRCRSSRRVCRNAIRALKGHFGEPNHPYFVTGDTFDVVDSSTNTGFSTPDSASGKHFRAPLLSNRFAVETLRRHTRLSLYSSDFRCSSGFQSCVDIGSTDSKARRLAVKANAPNIFQIEHGRRTGRRASAVVEPHLPKVAVAQICTTPSLPRMSILAHPFARPSAPWVEVGICARNPYSERVSRRHSQLICEGVQSRSYPEFITVNRRINGEK